MSIRAVEWTGGKVRFLDQTKLPGEEVWRETDDHRVVAEAIRRLEIRGAPLIGIAAGMAAALAAQAQRAASAAAADAAIAAAIAHLQATRPTAVNLAYALHRIRERHAQARAAGREVAGEILDEALLIARDEEEASARIASYGAELIPAGACVLTHCNTGSLAAGGEGTALGIIRAAHRAGRLRRVYATETRPLLQGARLTMWELLRAGIDAVLITDGTAATVMARGDVQAVLVGADRIAANGDTANKVGTHMLAVLAGRFGVPMIVAAPLSTVDAATPRGADIPIEERQPDEVTQIRGVRVAPAGARVFAPAFDVTPADLITAIVTDRGVSRPPHAEALAALLRTPAARPGGER